MFLDSTHDLLHVLVKGVVIYILLVVMLRISGNRTLSKMNSFDFVVTISLGSILATTFLSDTVSIAEGALAMGLLIFLQFLVTRTAVWGENFTQVIKSRPKLLYYNDHYIKDQLRESRVLKEEVEAAVRSSGLGSMEQVQAVVLETEGTLSVIVASDEYEPTLIHSRWRVSSKSNNHE